MIFTTSILVFHDCVIDVGTLVWEQLNLSPVSVQVVEVCDITRKKNVVKNSYLKSKKISIYPSQCRQFLPYRHHVPKRDP